MKRRLRVANRRRFITVISALIFILGVLVSSTALLLVTSADAPVVWTEVVVEEGDTLWAIARTISCESEDIRLKVHAIIDENRLVSATIHPGETLRVPVTATFPSGSLRASGY